MAVKIEIGAGTDVLDSFDDGQTPLPLHYLCAGECVQEAGMLMFCF